MMRCHQLIHGRSSGLGSTCVRAHNYFATKIIYRHGNKYIPIIVVKQWDILLYTFKKLHHNLHVLDNGTGCGGCLSVFASFFLLVLWSPHRLQWEHNYKWLDLCFSQITDNSHRYLTVHSIICNITCHHLRIWDHHICFFEVASDFVPRFSANHAY